MNVKELIANISRAKWSLEEELEQNGGELTEELLAQADSLEDMKELLAGEGIDELGRWLKSVQDEIAARKAEADAAARKVKNLKSYEDYVKGVIGQALDAIGEEKVKGSFYGFSRKTSTTSKVNQEAIENTFQRSIEHAARMAGIPPYIHIVLKSTTTELREAEAMQFVEETTQPSLGFTKPRANKE